MDRLAVRLLSTACLLSILAIGLFTLVALPQEASAQQGLDLESDTLTQSVLIHPPIDVPGRRTYLNTREHTYRPQLRLVDQLARDFTVMKVGRDGIGRAYKPGTAGKDNEDWYGWRQDVLAPFEGRVVRVARPDSTNEPGAVNRDGKTGLIVFEDEREGITAAYAHVREIEVEPGDTVARGDVVGKVGNNGTSRAPHVHVGAWTGAPDLLGEKTGAEPLQIQVDLYAEERPGDDAASR
ncbi:M23 family metallopeptidase [Salinibacter grassmerensis]|uniref:M23 family metallopeptidase n=1 Tax=Salinibacter grassmerensis TaxID=3040353 RepID=UPI0021E7E4FC|nr:M23 family metallopeptidase [Salinibacter grassmerensis]